ncbi:SurA N-terminal domain-containing protein [Aliidiomarina sp. Khilg15.8]
MLDRIREGSKGPTAKIILVLIIITFALTGVSGYLGGNTEDHVAEVNGEKITRSDFDRAYQSERAQMEEQMGDFFDTLSADENYMRDFREGVLERLIEERLTTQLAVELGFRPGPQYIRESIRNMSEFQVNGQFDNDRYVSLLMRAGFSPEQFRDYLEGEIGRSLLIQGTVASEFMLPHEAEQFQRLQSQVRSGEYIRIPADSYTQDVEVSDQEIEDFYYDNQSRYESDERIRLAYVELQFDDVLADIQVSDSEVRDYYDNNPGNFRSPERREIAHILIEFGDDEEAAREQIETIAGRIAAGEDFADMAREYSDDTFSGEDGGDLGRLERDSLDPDLEDAGFALNEEGEVSDVVRSEFGFHLIKLTSLQASEVDAFAEVEDTIRENLRREKAGQAYFDVQQELSRISFEMPESLEPAADAVGLEVQTTDWMDREGVQGFNDPQLLRVAFSEEVAEDQLNSELIELDERSIVMRARDYEPASVRPLAEVRDSIEQELTLRKAQQEAMDFAEQLLENYRQGEMPAALSMTAIERVSRRSAGDSAPGAVIERLFRLPPPGNSPSAGITQLRNGDVAIVAVTEIEEGEVNQDELEQIQQQFAPRYAERAYQALVEALKAEADISRNL